MNFLQLKCVNYSTVHTRSSTCCCAFIKNAVRLAVRAQVDRTRVQTMRRRNARRAHPDARGSSSCARDPREASRAHLLSVTLRNGTERNGGERNATERARHTREAKEIQEAWELSLIHVCSVQYTHLKLQHSNAYAFYMQ